ncbi:MAG: UDP-N-acetylmuramyl-tripeptide synthetase [Mogibacterium sp.]|nr:UDP-N-acetylmuramyl-tripeptide synthetase [Mogibacterium sp.]
MKKTLEQLAERLLAGGLMPYYHLTGAEETVITDITDYSKEATPGCLFVCKGAGFREEYLLEAIRRGAAGYVSEQRWPNAPREVPALIVSDIRTAMMVLSVAFFEAPSEELQVTAVTGTKGKTTTSHMLKAVLDQHLRAQGKNRAGLISSIEISAGETRKDSVNTTPESIELQRALRHAADSGQEYVVLEVSSQALKYQRTANTRFRTATFLNISEDHVSPIEHPDFEDYFASKLRIFRQCETAVVNLDADFSDRVLAEARAHAPETVTFSLRDPSADHYGWAVRHDETGLAFTVTERRTGADESYHIRRAGLVNVENALAVIATARSLGIPAERIRTGLEEVRVPGRMELFRSSDRKILAVVDFAHNKLSLERLFETVMQTWPDYTRRVLIIGSVGGKAFDRRKGIGEVAAKYADRTYISADDSDAEPFLKIAGEIAAPIEAQGGDFEIIEDRGVAIHKAISEVREPTVLLVCGRGREGAQKVDHRYLWYPSDVENVERYLADYDELQRRRQE